MNKPHRLHRRGDVADSPPAAADASATTTSTTTTCQQYLDLCSRRLASAGCGGASSSASSSSSSSSSPSASPTPSSWQSECVYPSTSSSSSSSPSTASADSLLALWDAAAMVPVLPAGTCGLCVCGAGSTHAAGKEVLSSLPCSNLTAVHAGGVGGGGGVPGGGAAGAVNATTAVSVAITGTAAGLTPSNSASSDSSPSRIPAVASSVAVILLLVALAVAFFIHRSKSSAKRHSILSTAAANPPPSSPPRRAMPWEDDAPVAALGHAPTSKASPVLDALRVNIDVNSGRFNTRRTASPDQFATAAMLSPAYDSDVDHTEPNYRHSAIANALRLQQQHDTLPLAASYPSSSPASQPLPHDALSPFADPSPTTTTSGEYAYYQPAFHFAQHLSDYEQQQQYIWAYHWHEWQVRQREWQLQLRERLKEREEARKAAEAAVAAAGGRGMQAPPSRQPRVYKPSPLSRVYSIASSYRSRRSHGSNAASGNENIQPGTPPDLTGATGLASAVPGFNDEASASSNLSRVSKSISIMTNQSGSLLFTSPEWAAPADITPVRNNSSTSATPPVDATQNPRSTPVGSITNVNGNPNAIATATSFPLANDPDTTVVSITSRDPDHPASSSSSSSGDQHYTSQTVHLSRPTAVPAPVDAHLSGAHGLLDEDDADGALMALEQAYAVLSAHEPASADGGELALAVGELVVIWRVGEDGWCEGYSVGGRRSGRFPLDCVRWVEAERMGRQ